MSGLKLPKRSGRPWCWPTIVSHQHSSFSCWGPFQRWVRVPSGVRALARGLPGQGSCCRASIALLPLQRAAGPGWGLVAGVHGCFLASQKRPKAPVKLSHTHREQQDSRNFIHFAFCKTGFILWSLYSFKFLERSWKNMDVIIFCMRSCPCAKWELVLRSRSL